MSITHEELAHGLDAFERLLEAHPILGPEFRASAEEFFGAPAPPGEGEPARAARRRWAEWALFERTSPSLGRLGAEVLLDAWRETLSPQIGAQADRWLESQAGCFAVTEVEAGTGVRLVDLAGLSDLFADEPQASRALKPGDLIVGRLYPTSEGAYTFSPAAGLFRNPELVEALERDLEQARRAHGRSLLRLAQDVLEKMFWPRAGEASGPAPNESSSGDPVEAAREFLAAGGLDEEVVGGLLRDLAARPLDPEHLTPGAGDSLARALEHVAFETDLDLEAARRILLAAWKRLGGEARAGSSGGARPDELSLAVAELDRRLAAGDDVEASFDDLERRLGLSELSVEEDETARAPAPDFPGVVPALVEEFLWERGRPEVGDPAARGEGAEVLRAFGRFGAELGLPDELSPEHLLRFAAFWLPESGELREAAGAERAIASLEAFRSWAVDQHDLAALDAAKGDLADLALSLPRIAPALAALAAAGAVQPTEEVGGELLEVLAAGAGEGGVLVRTLDGEERTVILPPQAARHLVPGDRLRAVRQGGRLEVRCVYPPQIVRLAPPEQS